MKAIAPFCYKNYTTNNYWKIFGPITFPNSEKAKTVKHISENQKQKIQHQKKQQEKLPETVRQTINETDPSQKINISNAGKNKEPKKKVMILGDWMLVNSFKIIWLTKKS